MMTSWKRWPHARSMVSSHHMELECTRGKERWGDDASKKTAADASQPDGYSNTAAGITAERPLFWRWQNEWWITDKSLNGTFIDGERLEKAKKTRIFSGSIVSFGCEEESHEER